jgi:magnesium-transporting ATPase (P-type)
MFSVVCKNYQSNSNYVIYCKGAPEDILEKLKDKEIRKIMEAKINQCKDSTN